MSKYIVKNCPVLKTYANPKTVDWCKENATYCQCVTDCRIKQVVNKCLPNLYEGGTDTDILEILQVQEME